jgi:hypothetical protein
MDGGLFIKGLSIFCVRSAMPRHYVEALQFLARADVGVFNEALSATTYVLGAADQALRRLESLEDLKPVVLPRS